MVSIMLYPCIFCGALLIDMFVLCVADNIFGCGCYFVVECYGSGGGGTLLDRPKSVCGVPVIPVCI